MPKEDRRIGLAGWASIIGALLGGLTLVISRDARSLLKAFASYFYTEHPQLTIVLLLSILVSILTVFVLKKGAVRLNPDKREADKERIRWLKELVGPNSPAIDRLKNSSFANPFYWETFAPLEKFMRDWESPEHHFHDKLLDEKRVALLAACSEFVHHLAANSFYFEGGGDHARYLVPPEWVDEQPDRYVDTIGQIEDNARAVVTLYEELIKRARELYG